MFYLKYDVVRASFSMGRPASETLATELMIRHHVNVRSINNRLSDENFELEGVATQTVLILQGGGALGAFECGVVKALEEAAAPPLRKAPLSLSLPDFTSANVICCLGLGARAS